MIKSEIKIRVLYAHTDKMGIVNNGRYFEFFEAGRNTLLREIFPYTKLEKINYGLPVIEAHANYLSSAIYDDIIAVKSFLNEMPTVKVKINYELFVNEKLIVTGYTIHSFIKLDSLKPARPPKEFLELFKSKFKSG
ncbi:MAG: acyl-CoA thioesterase [Chlorobi bacterium]|nr:acyl-CoA thioesterase [Chlorobiota bacterium]MCI0715023.1 acyl-CoA thioesterase [Chlorobiota bacterium]